MGAVTGDPLKYPPTTSFEHQLQLESPNVNPKRPRYGNSSGSQWKQLLPSPTSAQTQPLMQQALLISASTPDASSPSSSANPQLQVLQTQQPSAAAASSTNTAASSPSLDAAGRDEQQHQVHGHGQLRKGKYVSPVWKPYEMLMLAKGWHIQYMSAARPGSDGRGNNKSRAEKDREVAEFLNRHGVERDAKAAGTKWDNMLGDFRKVYQWERGGGRVEAGVTKSYFRLSPYERKNQHGLPTSFDEEVFEEMALFMGPRRSGSYSSLLQHTTVGSGKEDDDGAAAAGPSLPVPPVPLSSSVPNTLRRIGKMKMMWEECVNLWAEEGETQSGRVNICSPSTTASSLSSFLNADELVFFDDSMVATTLEAFENGPLSGFSTDRFAPGQQVRVFGRRRAAPRFHASWLMGCQDPSKYYLDSLKTSPATLPTLVELSRYLQEPPPKELRFPLRPEVYRDLPQGKDLFFTTSSEPLDCRMITYDILGQVLRSKNLSECTLTASGGRDSYIGLWDDCINVVVCKFCSLGIVFVRKPHHALPCSTECLWPNVTGFVRGLCLWRGEERGEVRGEGGAMTHPSKSLVQKFLWGYVDLPYVLGYYAVGCTVTFCALSRVSQDEQKQVLCTDLLTIDLSSQADRLRALIPCWRIATLLPLLADKCLNYATATSVEAGLPLFSDFERIELGMGDAIERTPNYETRYFSSERRWASVKEIYGFLETRIPHSEYMAESSETQLSLLFKPRGCKVKPRSVDQLIEALKNITKSLVALHDLSFMHRDISWDSVLRRVDSESDEEWFLSQFDAAAGAPQMSAFCSGVGEGGHAPEMKRGLHGVKVDVWGIGWLIKTSGLLLPMQLTDLQSRCLEHNQEMRPTAADCYHHLLQLSAAAAARDYSR
uniref:Protein kinase domain-containing protein n=1 Tax=Kalanchoe fedtschenkoi TaxID=63787 RepID=A0A7N0VAH4_KALFE